MSISALKTLISLSGTQRYVAREEDDGEERGKGYAALLNMYTSIKIL